MSLLLSDESILMVPPHYCTYRHLCVSSQDSETTQARLNLLSFVEEDKTISRTCFPSLESPMLIINSQVEIESPPDIKILKDEEKSPHTKHSSHILLHFEEDKPEEADE